MVSFSHQFSSFLLSDSVLNYLRSCVGVTPPVSLTSAWILRHEHHLLYLLLRLAHKLVTCAFTLTSICSVYICLVNYLDCVRCDQWRNWHSALLSINDLNYNVNVLGPS